ncbi:MAG: general secretion pathway protein GspB [Pseudomonadota bacterium]
MSLILDALRKADAERERGAVPGLHAQPVPPLAAEPQATAEPRPLVWIVIGATVGLASAFGVYFVGREPAPTPAPVAAHAVAPPPAAAVAEPAVARAAPSAPAAAPAPWPERPTRGTAKPAPPAGARAESKALAVASPPPIARDQLPADLRAELPPLAVGGSMYSATPANRTLIIDGRLYREGDQVAPGLTLEEIRLKSAVLDYKGHRFEIRF